MSNAEGGRSPVDSNRILKALDAAERSRLVAAGQIVHLDQRAILYEPEHPYTDVYFPGDAVISLITAFSDGTAVETATIGCEGMVGIPVCLGTGAMPVRVMNQLPGSALRIPAEVFSQAVEDRHMRHLIDRYLQAFLSQVLQNAACNAHHQIVARCARWLLMTHDRVGSQRLAITHELLAYMLGVRRAGVTEAAGALQQAGYIRYSRGRVDVLDRDGLETVACECYGVIRDVYDRLLGNEPRESAPYASVLDHTP